MNSINVLNLALFGTIFLLLHFGVEAESSSTCSLLDCLEGMGCQDNQGGMAVMVCLELWALQEVCWVLSHCYMSSILTKLMNVE